MKTLFQFVVFFILLGFAAKAQTTGVGTVQGFCTTGGQPVKVAGMSSTNTVLASYPRCTVTVYQSGTTTPATIYSDANQTPLSNPFTANADASWVFWAKNGGALDITMSGGTPNTFPQPFTIVSQFPSNAGGTGGGSPPAGVPKEIQTNANNTQFGGSKIFSDGATYAYTPLSQWAQYSVNSPLLNYCGVIQCAQAGLYGQNNALLNNVGVGTGYGKAYFQYRKNLFTGASAFNGYGTFTAYDPPGGSVIKMQEDNSVFHSSSISQNLSIATFAGKDADAAGIYSYLWCHGGYRWGGDEGCTNIRANGGYTNQHQSGFVLNASATIGATTISSGPTWLNPDDALTTGFIYDQSASPIASGNVTGYDATNHILTVTPGSVTPATTEGTTTTAITITDSTKNAATGVSATISVNITQGTAFTIDNANPVVVVCPNPDLEIVVPTAIGTPSGGTQTITANFFHGHPSGCIAAQGGTMGVLDLVADRIGNNWKTSYFVFGATDNSHIYEVTYVTGSRGVINAWQHNFGPGFDSHNSVATNVTGTGTTITACSLGQLTYNFGGQYVQLSGYTPSTFNGIYQASAVDKNLCVSMSGSATGTGTGGTISVGGSINSPDGLTQGPGGFKIWETARIRQIGTTATTDANGITTNAYNYTFTLSPNHFTAVSGHTVWILDDMQAKVEPLAAYGVYDVAPSGNLNRWFTAQASGYGVTGDAFRMVSALNLNPWNWYEGGGGTGHLFGPRGVSIEGPYTWNIWMHQPLQGGFGIWMGRNPNTQNVNLNNTFYPLFVEGAGGGGGGFTINYNPNSGLTFITSGTGNGVYTSITMDPLNFTLGAALVGGTFTMQGQNYNFTGLAGSGTRAMTVDSTGKVGTATLGTVTSVGLTGPTWLGISGSPVTGAGSIALAPAAFGASGVSHSVGVVPDPGAVAGTTNFLREDSTWANPLSGGISSTFTITTTTGTCNFTYTNGLLTAKTGSC